MRTPEKYITIYFINKKLVTIFFLIQILSNCWNNVKRV